MKVSGSPSQRFLHGGFGRKMSARLCGFTREPEPGGSFPRGRAPRAAWPLIARAEPPASGRTEGLPPPQLAAGPSRPCRPRGPLLPRVGAGLCPGWGPGAAPAASALRAFAGS